MSRRVGGGTMAEHFAVAARKRGKALPPPPALPEHAEAVWDAFGRLNASRTWTQAGPAAISFAEIDAFVRLTDADLAPWEVEAIQALDECYRSTVMNGK